jgi:hypothetical protein
MAARLIELHEEGVDLLLDPRNVAGLLGVSARMRPRRGLLAGGPQLGHREPAGERGERDSNP